MIDTEHNKFDQNAVIDEESNSADNSLLPPEEVKELDLAQAESKASTAMHEIDPNLIDLNALWVVRRLRAKGHEAYLTGGCVRDLLMQVKPKDFDVATSARPEEVKSIFRNCRLIGRRFLLAHVVFPGGKIIETATFRAKPSEEIAEDESGDDLLVMQDNVFGTMKEDAFRRDLTINGLFYDPVEGKVIDYVGGKKDLAARLIRTIGDPEIRLQEDPVRILRAIRFAKRLGFSIEENTLSAMREFSKDMLRCAPARLQEEVVRLLTSGKAKESLLLALEVGVLDILMPELLEGMGLLTKPQEGVDAEEPINTAENDDALRYWHDMLEALDQIYAKDCNIASSVAFTALLLPAYARLEKASVNERNWIDRLCVNWSERIRLTRRDQDLIRILLSAIPLFSLDRVHHKSAQYLVRKPWFREGLLTYIVHLVAKKASLEQVKIWKLLAHEADKIYKQDKRSLRPQQTRFRKKRLPLRGQHRRYRRGPAEQRQTNPPY
ncbi:MAG TPA: polynucleotide adenylyltransferase PcnB [Myxococcota bacterium]|nr:polynucleotide adenylyltransferase PcnB [Myxococcota bacterium]